jgi:hypothetical protein
MMRGKIFDQYLNESGLKDIKQIKKGRNESLMNKRNIYLFYRYYYYSKIHRMRYEDVIKQLSNDFFITQRTDIDIIQNNTSQVKNVFDEKLNIRQLKKKFDLYNWINKESTI